MKKIIILLILLSVLGCSKEKKNEEKSPIPIEYLKTKFNLNEEENFYIGKINSEALSKLNFRVSGTLLKRPFDLGDDVKKGDVLAELDPQKYYIQYMKSLADLEKGKTILLNDKIRYDRDKILYLENSISKAKYDNTLSAYKSSKSQVKALEAISNQAKLQLSYTKLIAPVDGTIGEEITEVNENVTPQTTIFVINSSGKKYVEFNVPETIIHLLKKNEKVTISLNLKNHEKIKGTIKNIGTISSGFGNTYPVKATLDINSKDIKVGMTANVKVDLKSQNKVIIVPTEAFLKDRDGKNYLYVVKNIEKKVGSIEKKYVIIGGLSSTGLIIKSGISENEVIIIKGVNRLQEGQEVFLLKDGGENEVN